jgi:hypothetical protein
MRVISVKGRRGISTTDAVGVEESGPQALGADVEAEEEGRGGHR